jgi:hypothetical protein
MKSGNGLSFSSQRQLANACLAFSSSVSANTREPPVVDRRNIGAIVSVLMLSLSIGAAGPLTLVNAGIELSYLTRICDSTDYG